MASGASAHIDEILVELHPSPAFGPAKPGVNTSAARYEDVFRQWQALLPAAAFHMWP